MSAPSTLPHPRRPGLGENARAATALLLLLASSPALLSSCNRAADKAAIRSETERADKLRNELAGLKKKDSEVRARLDLMRQQAALTPTLAALKDGQAEVEKRRTDLTAIVKSLQEANRACVLDVESARKTAAAGVR